MIGDMGLSQTESLRHFYKSRFYKSAPSVQHQDKSHQWVHTMVMVVVDDSAETDGANESA